MTTLSPEAMYLGPIVFLLFGIALKLDVSAYWIIAATLFLLLQGLFLFMGRKS